MGVFVKGTYTNLRETGATARWNAARVDDLETRIDNAFNTIGGGQVVVAQTVTTHTTLSMTGQVSVLWVVTMANSSAAKLEISGWSAGASVTLVKKQDATGNRLLTSWPTARWDSVEGEPDHTLAANSIDVATFFHDGTETYGFPSGTDMQ